MSPRHRSTAEEVLSNRELEILRLIGEGRGSKEIAFKLQVSKETISSHRKEICKKLNLHSTAELIAYSVRNLTLNPLTRGLRKK